MRLNLEEWRFLASPFYDVICAGEEKDFSVVAHAQDAYGLLLTKVLTPAETLIHDPATRKSVCHEYLLFEQFYSGGGPAEVGDVSFSVHPSRLHLIDMSRRYTSMKSWCSSEGVLIPHHMVGYDPSVDPPFSSVEVNSSQGKLLRSAHKVMRDAIRIGNADGDQFVCVFLDLVKRFMLQKTSLQHIDTATQPFEFLVREFVHANLSDPDLGVEKIAAAFGVSRSVLYRHFERHGGVQRYIRNCRLDRCMFEIVGAPTERGRISAVARRWRFSDATHFNRVFKERFGLAPSECVGRTYEAIRTLPTEVTTITHSWLDALPRS